MVGTPIRNIKEMSYIQFSKVSNIFKLYCIITLNLTNEISTKRKILPLSLKRRGAGMVCIGRGGFEIFEELNKEQT